MLNPDPFFIWKYQHSQPNELSFAQISKLLQEGENVSIYSAVMTLPRDVHSPLRIIPVAI